MEQRTTFAKPKYLSEEWFDVRRTQNGGFVFGASECPALMGVSPFDTLVDLCVKKLNPPTQNNNNDATRRGHILEPALIEHCRREYGVEVWEPTVMFRHGRLVATLDGAEMQGDKCVRVFEAKTTTAYALNDGIPETYFWQGQAQLDATGADEVVFVVLDRTMRIGFWEMKPDFTAIAELRAQAELIGQRLDNNEIPTAKDIAFTHKQVEALFPNPSGSIELSAEQIDAVLMWSALTESAKEMQQKADAAKDVVANFMRNMDIGTVGGLPLLSYKEQSRRGGVDYEQLLKVHPELQEEAKQYRKPDSHFRVLRKLKQGETK
jgi:putative phage-type endonuclease